VASEDQKVFRLMINEAQSRGFKLDLFSNGGSSVDSSEREHLGPQVCYTDAIPSMPQSNRNINRKGNNAAFERSQKQAGASSSALYSKMASSTPNLVNAATEPGRGHRIYHHDVRNDGRLSTDPDRNERRLRVANSVNQLNGKLENSTFFRGRRFYNQRIRPV
jgi:hypothetical protein